MNLDKRSTGGIYGKCPELDKFWRELPLRDYSEKYSMVGDSHYYNLAYIQMDDYIQLIRDLMDDLVGYESFA